MPEKMIENIHWLGHDGFYAEGSKIVYFDPYEISGGPKADLILITHEHFDHCSPDDVAKVIKDDTVIVTEADSAQKLSGNVQVLKPGESTEVAGVKVTALPSYNVDKDFHPRANNWLGFVVELDGVTIYHAGDADFIPEMKDLNVDIALIPVSGTYVMTADQGIEAARAIKPRIAVPMHYGAIVGSEDDAKKFAEALKDEITVVIKEKE
ncbi:MAG: MBL fold metallo-hydrolase [Deltaproteobacteria bacterium]|nr:MBL fold metallo-hydrolase [Deltaproteobacteria bacterium]MBW2052875.1 MBL fold metallo-hydrolase [Deltaproteobacteria bacterium]MBW2142758.1 MBL fold metallo-hydrolase [Deltaproteobacteria bacterium]MBW2322821.1 MBL fold metallo-hydrolase [Deltaproteobacteria bacterium]